MQMLYPSPIFGPITSRRLGQSLGVNLMPADSKLCSFDCVYCECGFNFVTPGSKRPTKEEVISKLDAKLDEIRRAGGVINTITFAGNGEPTLHPHFLEIINGVVESRNRHFPEAVISVLSNATHCGKPEVFEALNKVDNNILKLDSAIEQTAKLIDRPTVKYSVAETVENLKRFNGNFILQTLFLKGVHNGVAFDNTTPEEVDAWLEVVKAVRPKEVMVYSLDRKTPVETLEKASAETLKAIAAKVEALGVKVLLTL
ncbi:MAG: radical SAM protein [Paludibacteraceae bacterium]|nr:radical SAM protein [Paludibacteraceae bacterium]